MRLMPCVTVVQMCNLVVHKRVLNILDKLDSVVPCIQQALAGGGALPASAAACRLSDMIWKRRVLI